MSGLGVIYGKSNDPMHIFMRTCGSTCDDVATCSLLHGVVFAGNNQKQMRKISGSGGVGPQGSPHVRPVLATV